MSKGKYNIGDYISSKAGKLVIANNKKRLIVYAEKEIEEWIEARDKAIQEINKWQDFIDKLEKK